MPEDHTTAVPNTDAIKANRLKIIFASLGSIVLLGLTIFGIVKWEKLKRRFNAFKYKYFASDSKTDDQPDQPDAVPTVWVSARFKIGLQKIALNHSFGYLSHY